METHNLASTLLKLRDFENRKSDCVLTRAEALRMVQYACSRFADAQAVIDLIKSTEDPRPSLRESISRACPRETPVLIGQQSPFGPSSFEQAALPGSFVEHHVTDGKFAPLYVCNLAELTSIAAYALKPDPWPSVHMLGSFFSAMIPPNALGRTSFATNTPHFTALYAAALAGSTEPIVSY